MALIEIKIPSPGESITEVEIASWLVEDGSIVAKNTELAEIESDKATLTLVAEEGGKIEIKAAEGTTIKVGAVACSIDTKYAPTSVDSAEKEVPETDLAKADVPVVATKEQVVEPVHEKVKVTPLAKELMKERGINIDEVLAGLRRISKSDIESLSSTTEKVSSHSASLKKEASREKTEKRMSSLRRKLSERLVSVKNETAMLTTFNEVDMKNIMELRQKYQKAFTEKHEVKLGFMSFFIKAASLALQQYPNVNSMIDGEDIVSYSYTDIAVAVSAPKGLMVPVIRNVESMGLAEIEIELKNLAQKARNGKLSIAEMTGGTFTITNGGVFGSLLSTPIINPPQSGILGMHNIVERPVAVDGQVVVRPMMYTALSYDHRIIDGKDSVGFLVKLKELIESPEKMLLGGTSPEELLLEL